MQFVPFHPDRKMPARDVALRIGQAHVAIRVASQHQLRLAGLDPAHHVEPGARDV